jgi:tetratricopeptide (TPR) repeat protein
MNAPEQMDDATHAWLSDLCAEGDALAEQGQYDEALVCYGQAWGLIPEPKENWNASTWVLAAIGDACFLKNDFPETRKALEFAMHCPEAIGNPFLHLRLGQALYEQGEEDRAADELIRAYMGAGPEIFANDDPKYLAFLSTRARLD